MRRSFEDDYPNLARVEDYHYHICSRNPDTPFLAAHGNFQKLITTSSTECKIDASKCAMLDILEQVCKKIDSSTVDIATLHRITTAVHRFYIKFLDWDKAFDAVDVDGS